MVTFFKCGHGDCAMINDTFNINGVTEQVKLYVDLGPRSRSFRVPVPQGMANVDLLITHSDDDHCCGYARSLNPNRIFVPAFFAEMETILLKLIFHKNTGILNPNNVGRLVPVEESHPLVYSSNLKWDVFNPIRNKWGRWVSSLSIPLDGIISRLDRFLSDMDIDLDVEGFIGVAREARKYYREHTAEYSDEDLRLFVVAVLFKIYLRSRKQKISLSKAISAFRCHDANDYSIVFKYIDSDDNTFLFTGDAPSDVYVRPYQNKSVRSRILKVPHHGSKTGFGLTNTVPPTSVAFSKIDPEFMVVSNANYLKAPPNIDVLDFLSNQPGKHLLLTNDFTRLPRQLGRRGHRGVTVPYVFPQGIKAEIR